MLISFMLFILGVFALFVGNWLAVIICFSMSYFILLPALFISIRAFIMNGKQRV